MTALLLLLLLAPSSAAWEDGTLDGVAVRDATLTGTDVVLKVNGADGDAEPRLSIQAERLRLETWRVYKDVNLPYVAYSSTANTTRGESTWHDATVSLLEARPHVLLFLQNATHVQLQDTRMSVAGHYQPSVEETLTSEHHRKPSRVAVPTLHQVSSSTGVLTLAGDFALSIWDWDIRVRNATASEDYWSGARNATGPASPAVDGKEDQRIYLEVTNGTLRLPLAGLDVRDLFVAGTVLQAASAVLDLADQDTPLSLSGPLRFGLGPVENGSFPGTVLPQDRALSGSPTSDAETAAPPAPSTSTVGEEGLWTTSLLLLLLAVAVAVFVGWRAVRLVRLRRAMNDGDYGSVAAGAGLENSRRFGAEVVVARVVCMVKTADYAAAASLLEKRGAQLAPGVRAYLWACVHAGTGAVDEARDAVIESIVTDPGMASEVAANRSLRRFLADVEEGAYS